MPEESPSPPSTQPVVTPVVVNRRSQGDPRLPKSITKFLHRVASSELPRYEQARVYVFPFIVGEDRIRKIDTRIRESLSEIPLAQDVDFSSETRFRDLASVRFDNFDEFLSKAGDKNNPESVALYWNKIAFDSNGDLVAGEVSIVFVTEQKTSLQKLSAGEFNLASVTLSISGSDQRWTERVFGELSPHIEATQLGGIFKVLWIFRNKWIIQLLTQVVSWSGFYIGIHAISSLFERRNKIDSSAVLKTILTSPDITHKFDQYAKYVFTPTNDPWWEPFIMFLGGASTYVLIYLFGVGLLPKLTPKSSIAIGLSSQRAEESLNVFRFVVFTLLIGSGLIPILISFIEYVLRKLI